LHAKYMNQKSNWKPCNFKILCTAGWMVHKFIPGFPDIGLRHYRIEIVCYYMLQCVGIRVWHDMPIKLWASSKSNQDSTFSSNL
jgi:hypothetical protein